MELGDERQPDSKVFGLATDVTDRYLRGCVGSSHDKLVLDDDGDDCDDEILYKPPSLGSGSMMENGLEGRSSIATR